MKAGFLNTFYQRFIRIRGNPREIALGLALGLFIGFSPTMGAQILIAVSIASVLKWNKFTAAIGVQVTNPLTAPVIYGFTYWIGARLMGLQNHFDFTLNLDWRSVVDMIDQAPMIFLAMTIGGVVVGLPAALVGYFACHAAVNRYQQDLKARLARQKENIKTKMLRKKMRKREPNRATPPKTQRNKR